MKRAFLICLVIIVGCEKKPIVINQGDFQAIDTPSRLPIFERVYTASLSANRNIKITIKQSDYHYETMPNIDKTGELDQADGRWVLFDPDKVADKILDPKLIPEVQHLCDEINAADKEWRDSKPSQFTDSDGAIWKRVN